MLIDVIREIDGCLSILNDISLFFLRVFFLFVVYGYWGLIFYLNYVVILEDLGLFSVCVFG